MERMTKLWMLLALTVLAACTDNMDNVVDNPEPTAIDEGPVFTDRTVGVNRDGNLYGQVSLRFYSDMPSVAYISVAEFHRLMTGGEPMTVSRQGDLYVLATKGGSATVDVKADYLYSTSYAGFVDLMWMVDGSLAPNTMYDGSRYLKFISMEHPSTFKPFNGVRFDFNKYDIDLHDDGTNVYIPFATLADIYSDCNMHNATCHDDLVMVSTKLETFGLNLIDPVYSAKPYQREAVAADMAKFRYQELCFVFDNLFGFPGRSVMEQGGMAEKGFDATLESVENGPAVKKLLQSADNTDFAWGTLGLQYLMFDGGHTNMRVTVGVPSVIEDDYLNRVIGASSGYPEALALYNAWLKEREKRYDVMAQLADMRMQAYGDVIYKANSDKTLGVVVIDSFSEQDNDAWDKYYASQKSDADWQELMKSYRNDSFIAFLYALQQATDDGVKNLVIDITQNDGGSVDIVAADVALLRKNRTVQLWSQDVLEGKNNITSYLVDSNFDGVFDEKDDTNPKFDCSGMNIGVLSSKLAFSCGTQFPAAMKDYGFPIIGEQSGGGSCCVQLMQTADGFNYIISTYRDRSTDKNFVNVDAGVLPTEGYAFDYTHFYDMDFLNTKLQEFYGQ